MSNTARGLLRRQYDRIVETALSTIHFIDPFVSRVLSSQKAIPISFLGILFLAFGLTISSLGIYQDDWVFVYNAYARGPQGLWDFLNADGTPFSSLMNISLFYILGFKPLYWHLAALLARWLTVTIFWSVLRRLWPANVLQNFFVALLFAVYPFFTLQPLAFTFLHVWIAYFFLGLSFYWMILSIQRPERFWPYLMLSLAAGIVTELTLEYFMGLELLRPVILWFVLRDQEKDVKRRLTKIIRLWLPYLIVFGIYVWWRFFIYKVPIENRNNPVGLKLLFTDPVAEIAVLLSNIVPDVLTILVSTWYKVVDPLFFDLVDRQNLLFILLSVFAAAGLFLIFNKGGYQAKDGEEITSTWIREALLLGGIIVLLGLIPPYVAGLFINEKNPLWNSRFGLASMPGAALFTVALVELVISKTKVRILILSILIGLSVGYHARYTNDFRWAWRKEQNLYRQLIVRIPALRPNTAIVAEGEILYKMGDYPTAYAINSLYAKPLAGHGPVDYWFYGITTNFGSNMTSFLDGMDIEATHRSVTFTGRSDQSLIVSFEPDLGQCLYVIRPEDASFRKLPPLLKSASHLSALERIDTTAEGSSPFLDVIGLHYPDDWCTYYQKADLARQKRDYQKVIELWNEAQDKGFSPGSNFEYLLFLDAYTQLGRWDDAAQLTFQAIHVFPILRRPMCDYWSALPITSEMDETIGQVRLELGCASD